MRSCRRVFPLDRTYEPALETGFLRLKVTACRERNVLGRIEAGVERLSSGIRIRAETRLESRFIFALYFWIFGAEEGT